ncbi:MAG: hypothetical protein WHU10_06550 [Fimbriimonadales bacterium]
MDRTLEAFCGDVPGLQAWVAAHPRLQPAGPLDEPALRVAGRQVVVGHADEEQPHGLPELMDNNPIVCASRVVVPGPAATLAWIALGPACKAGFVLADETSPPVLLRFSGLASEDLGPALSSIGWKDGTQIEWRGGGLAWVATLEAHVPLDELAQPDDIAGAYDEALGRSFFVRRVSPCEWIPHRVLGSPAAEYWLEVAPSRTPVLRVGVAADLRGKLGGAQMVHALNVMLGWEETLGLEEPIP